MDLTQSKKWQRTETFGRPHPAWHDMLVKNLRSDDAAIRRPIDCRHCAKRLEPRQQAEQKEQVKESQFRDAAKRARAAAAEAQGTGTSTGAT